MNASALPSLLAALAMIATGCSSSIPVKTAGGNAKAPAFTSPSGLTGTYAAPDIILHWKNNSKTDGGNIVEFNLLPPEEYTVLAFLPPDLNDFRHEDAAPDTHFHYRLHPFFGQPSSTVEITTGKIPESDAPNMELEGPLPSDPAHPRTTRRSLRSTATFAEAAPAGLTAIQASPTSIDLRWQDRASDEDGYLLEISIGAPDDFKVCALLPPDTTSFKKIFQQPETKCYFRVRAFFYGTPTEPITVTTSAGANAQATNL